MTYFTPLWFKWLLKSDLNCSAHLCTELDSYSLPSQSLHCSQQCEGFRAHLKPRQPSERPLMPPCQHTESSCIIHLLIIQSRALIFTSYSVEIVCSYWWLDMMILMILWFYSTVKPWERLGCPPCLHSFLLLWSLLGLRLFLELCGCAHGELRYCLEHNKTL